MGLETIMYQLSIQYFWPLTEQIPLDLDYTGCDIRPSNGLTVSSGNTGLTWVSAAATITPTLRVDGTDIDGYMKIGSLQIGQKKPNFIRKYIYKLLGFSWENK